MVQKGTVAPSVPPQPSLRRLNFVRTVIVTAAGYAAPVFNQLQSVGDGLLERLGRKVSERPYPVAPSPLFFSAAAGTDMRGASSNYEMA